MKWNNSGRDGPQNHSRVLAHWQTEIFRYYAVREMTAALYVKGEISEDKASALIFVSVDAISKILAAHERGML